MTHWPDSPQSHHGLRRPSLFGSVSVPGLGKHRKASVDRTVIAKLSPSVADLYSSEYNSNSNKKKKTTFDHAPIPPVGAMVVATRAEAEAAFNNNITSSKTSMVQKLGHKHKNSDSSGGSSQRTVKNPLAHVGGRMASLTHAFYRGSGKSVTSGPPGLHMDTTSPPESPQTPKMTISPPVIQNISKPQANLDDNRMMLKKTSSLKAQKKSNLFSHVVDLRRESKAEKRRAELKASIRLVPETLHDGSNSQQKGSGGGGAHTWL